MHGKRMTEALNEVRSFRDATNEGGPGSGPQKGGKKFSSSEIKKAYGILNDPRYKQGNYTGAAKAINKLAPGLADHPDVKNALKRANEEVELTEKKAEYLSLQMSRPGDAKRVERWLYKNMSQVNTPYDGPYLSDMNVEFENVDDADDLMAKLKRAGFNFKVDTREELDLPATGDTTTSNASQENETVELDEAKFTPAQISALKKAYGNIAPMRVSVKNTNKMRDLMKTYSKDLLKQLAVLDIPMVSNMAKELT